MAVHNPPLRSTFLVAAILLSSTASAAERQEKQEASPVRRYALLIGVRTYSKTELRNLQFPESDVERLAEALIASGYRKEDVRILTNTAGADDADLVPNARNVREQLRLALSDRREDESVLIAFAGHGLQFKDAEEHYFCPTDARLADRSTLVSLSEVYERMKACRAGFKLLLVDACRNDPQAEGARARAEVDLESVTRPQTREPPGGVAALFSCAAGEKSFEHSDLKQGVFFHFVVKGLKGDADANRDGTVTVSELCQLVQSRVPDFTKSAFSVRQTPSLVGEISGSVPLTRVNLAAGPLARGKQLLEAFQYDDAIAVLTQAVEADPENVDCYRARADAYSGKCDRAARVADLTRALELAPDDPEALKDRAWTRLDLSDRSGAASDFDRALELITPHDAKTFTLRGSVRRGLLQLGRPTGEASLEDYTEAIRRDPKHVDAWTGRGALYMFQQRFREALSDMSEAVRLEPENWICHEWRGVTLVERSIHRPEADDFERALADFAAALRINPNAVSLYVARGHGLRLAGKDKEALLSYDEALRRNPQEPYALNGRGNSFSNLEEYGKAVAEYGRALAMLPESPMFLVNRAGARRQQKSYDEAEEDCRAALERDPTYAYAWNQLALIHENQNQYEDALIAIDRAIELKGEVPLFGVNRGVILKGLGRFDEALSVYRDVLERSPRMASAYIGRGDVYYEQEEWERSIQEYTRAIGLDPSSPGARVALALAYDNKGDHARAIEAYSEYLKLKPKDATALNLRGRCHRRLKNFRAAVADSSEAIRIEPDNPIRYYDRGRAYHGLKEYVKAIEDFNRAISKSPMRRDYFYYYRGDAYYENGNYAWAIADFSEAIRLDPTYSLAYISRALAYRKTGQHALADADRRTYDRLEQKSK